MVNHGTNYKLRDLSGISSVYILPDDPITRSVLVPGFQSATNVDAMMGFFSSHSLATLAPGLATFVNDSTGIFRLVISPYLSDEDRKAIEVGTKDAGAMASEVLEKFLLTEDEIERHTLRCLSWLIETGRIEIKVALMQTALFHMKVWLFHEGEDVLAVHGSANMTHAGIEENIEQVAVSKSWENPDGGQATGKFQAQFSSLWNNQSRNCVVIDIPDAVREKLLRSYRGDAPPQESELRSLFQKAEEITDAGCDFKIPEGLLYDEGPFGHQGRAVNAWCDAGFHGVLEMATGSGKTIASMIAAHRLHRGHEPLLIVVAAPYVPLIQQWCEEIQSFGLDPVNLTIAGGRLGRGAQLGRLRRRLRGGTSDVEVVVVSHRALVDKHLQRELESFVGVRLLIADEAHNLGSEGFIADAPDCFDYRLGLSATPVRQYDDVGTDALFKYLGPVVFRFSLEEAIGKCLVPYDYYVHPVDLTETEIEQWHILSERIRKNAWRTENGQPDEFLSKLLRDRRAILENASNKVGVLKELLETEDRANLKHVLVYASDKDPRQLEMVNRMLGDMGLLFHQLTDRETANRTQTREILQAFQAGTIQALTAKRVLDEGVNIPQIRKAFILASTTVERQWVQRRGRLLRTCDEIGKTHSEIHDFVALPADLNGLDDDERRIVGSELKRVQEFARLARNAGRPDGPLNVLDSMIDAIYLEGF